MKIKQEHYDYMKTVIDTFFNNNDMAFIIGQYETGQFSNADKTKDLSMRFRWDIFHACGLTKFACDTLYSYMHDEHIDTALRNIIPHKLVKSF